MSTDPDAGLRQLFQDVQLSGDFEDRLFARVRSDLATVGTEHRLNLRAIEQADYFRGLQRLAQWRRRAIGFFTLDALAIAASIVCGEVLLTRFLRAMGQLSSGSGAMQLLPLLPFVLVALVLERTDYGRSPE